MFLSIKGKIIFFITLVMIVTTVVNIFFTNRDVGRAMMTAQEKSARNILHSLDLMIKGDYHNLLSEKRTMTLAKRQMLEDSTRMIASVFNGYVESGPRGDKAAALAVKWLETAPFNQIDTIIIDKNSVILSSSTPSVTNENYPGLTDMKQRNISSVMAFNKLKADGDFAIYIDESSPEGRKSVMAYFLPFSPLDLTIATAIDISNIEAQAEANKEKMIESLKKYTTQLNIARHGFVYIFDAGNSIVIGPPEHTRNDLFKSDNTLTGTPIHQEIIRASESDVTEMRYISSSDPDRNPMEVYCSYFKPLKWYISVIVPVREISRPAKDLVIRQSLIIVLIFMIGIIAVFFLVTRIANPLNLLSSYAKKLPEQDFTQPLPEHSPIDHLPGIYKDEVGDLAASFILMQKELSRNIRNLIEITASRQRIESELSIAREIQLGMVPKTFPSFPEHKEFDLYATLKPAKEIGGDLYDFFLIDDTHLCFTLGDVSDKGIPSALLMVVTRTLIRTLGEKTDSPRLIMENINNIISADNPRSMFVTLVVGILNIRTGEIIYANGGHNPPVVMPKKRAAFFKKEKNDPLVGAIPGMAYSDHSLVLAPGDAFFLYTDGVNEAMNPEGELFSNERLLSVIEQNKENSVLDVIENMLDSIRAHTRTAPQSDDIAMLMIRYAGDTPAGTGKNNPIK